MTQDETAMEEIRRKMVQTIELITPVKIGIVYNHVLPSWTTLGVKDTTMKYTVLVEFENEFKINSQGLITATPEEVASAIFIASL